MENSRTLMQKYEIPVNQLDFAYIRECKDARRMEKIVHILRSGEEGFYPDLTKCAEEKLKELKPNSRYFRFEEPIQSHEALPENEWKPIYDWNNDIKTKDNKLLELSRNLEKEKGSAVDEDCIPPIRKTGKIQTNTQPNTPATTTTETKTSNSASKSKTVACTDYNKWDRYDPDEEILRMDLAEERVQEEVERKNRLNLQKSATPKIVDITEEDRATKKRLEKLSDLELDKLLENYRLKGNEYFRAKEYENAIEEYSRVIELGPSRAAAAYNNRAMTYIKMQKFKEAIQDCEHCLKLEPNNLKARIRHAESIFGYGRRRESYDLYLKVLELDASNAIALKALEELRKEFGELPPAHATRLQIQESSSTSSESKPQAVSAASSSSSANSVSVVQKPKKPSNSLNKTKDYNLADLVVPNKVVNNKFASAALSHMKPPTNASAAAKPPSDCQLPVTTELRMPLMGAAAQKSTGSGKLLIQEL